MEPEWEEKGTCMGGGASLKPQDIGYTQETEQIIRYVKGNRSQLSNFQGRKFQIRIRIKPEGTLQCQAGIGDTTMSS